MSIAGFPAAGWATVCGAHRGKGSTAGQTLRSVSLASTLRIQPTLYENKLSALLAVWLNAEDVNPANSLFQGTISQQLLAKLYRKWSLLPWAATTQSYCLYLKCQDLQISIISELLCGCSRSVASFCFISKCFGKNCCYWWTEYFPFARWSSFWLLCCEWLWADCM